MCETRLLFVDKILLYILTAYIEFNKNVLQVLAHGLERYLENDRRSSENCSA